MSQTVYLHAGLEKTGTTYLQSLVVKNKRFLKKNGIIYPKAGLASDHHYWLAKSMGFYYQADRIDPVQEEKAVEGIHAFVRKNKTDNILISSEHFDFNVNIDNLSRLRQLFADYPVQVILTFRNQIDYVQSLFTEHIRWGGIKTFKEFYEMCDQVQRFDYYRKYDLWRQAGFDVIVIDYDREKQSLVDRFFEILGCRIDDSFRMDGGERNASESINFIEFVRNYNIGLQQNLRRDSYFKLKALTEKLNPDLLIKTQWPIPVELRDNLIQKNRGNLLLKNELKIPPGTEFIGGDLLEKFQNRLKEDHPNIKPLVDALIKAAHL